MYLQILNIQQTKILIKYQLILFVSLKLIGIWK
jgi:hypothetical protein